MDLSGYIEKVGDKEAARRFGVSEDTAKAYRLGYRRPRVTDAPRIRDASGGLLDWDTIYPDIHAQMHGLRGDTGSV